MKFQKIAPQATLVKYGLALLLTLGFIGAKAQAPATQPEDKIYTSTEKTPEPTGGLNALYKFISENIKYPREMREKGIQGNVMVQFVVEKDGSLSNIKSMRDPGYGSGEESVRVMGLSPKWIPGQQNGKVVRAQYTIPIRFTLGQTK